MGRREGEIKLEQEDFQLLTEWLEIIEDERMSYNIYPPDPLSSFSVRSPPRPLFIGSRDTPFQLNLDHVFQADFKKLLFILIALKLYQPQSFVFYFLFRHGQHALLNSFHFQQHDSCYSLHLQIQTASGVLQLDFQSHWFSSFFLISSRMNICLALE